MTTDGEGREVALEDWVHDASVVLKELRDTDNFGLFGTLSDSQKLLYFKRRAAALIEVYECIKESDGN